MENLNSIVVEDFSLIADAWEEILFSMGFKNVIKHKSANNVLESISKHSPKLCLIDINIKGSINGLDLTKEIVRVYPEMKVIILTIHDESFFVKAALKAGAVGYVTKSSPLEELKTAINNVIKGEMYLCKEVTESYEHYSIPSEDGFLFQEN